MAIEYERKYRTTKAILEEIDKSFSENALVYQMETIYFDTPAGALSARHITLRRRQENGESICTLKLPAQGIARKEFQVACDKIEDAIPVLCKLSRWGELIPLTVEGVMPVCGAKFTRRARKLTVGSSEVELALDSGVLTGGGKEIPLFEVEVELLSGTPMDADLYGRLLQAKYGLAEEHYSKFRRALALAKGETQWN